jgi:DNA invertase Pin-like site-specific DNA recombinase
VVWKLDRLSRSLRDVLTMMERLGDSGAGFRSLTEAIDATPPAGRMMPNNLQSDTLSWPLRACLSAAMFETF